MTLTQVPGVKVSYHPEGTGGVIDMTGPDKAAVVEQAVSVYRNMDPYRSPNLQYIKRDDGLFMARVSYFGLD